MTAQQQPRPETATDPQGDHGPDRRTLLRGPRWSARSAPPGSA